MRLLLLALLPAASFATRGPAQGSPPSEETIAFFRQNCASCHTIGGGRLTGPDLKDAPKRRPRPWLTKFILDPRGTIDGGDPYAQKLFREARGVYMQQVPGLDAALAGKLIDLVASESAAEKSQFAGSPASDRPLTAADTERGERLFLGRERFGSGAPACVSCHAVKDLAGFGGGRLGPDLTNAYARLEGRKALAAWLAAPPSNVMRPIFTRHRIDDEERLALVAFLADKARGGEEPRRSVLGFVLAGFAGAGLVLVLLDFLWRNRYRAVRRPLVEGLSPAGSRR